MTKKYSIETVEIEQPKKLGKSGTNLLKIEKKEVAYTCPKRGRVVEIVEVKVYDTGGKPPVQTCH